MNMKGIKKFLYYSTTFIIFISLLYFCGNFFLDTYYLKQYNEVNGKIDSNKLVDASTSNETVVTSNNEQSNKTTESNSKEIQTLDDYRAYYNNTDIVGQISIINTDFSMLLVQSDNNTYYLNHLVNKEKNKLGATFVDYRVDLSNSKKINIYGHNNGNNSISFNKLMNYLDKSYYENHRLIQIDTDDDVDVYEIFSVQVVSNNKHMQVSFTNVEWYLYIEEIIEDSLYDTNTTVDDITKMITLQTCTNNKENEFLLLHGRKLES